MRFSCGLALSGLALAFLASCNQQSDPDLRAAVTALANAQAARPAATDSGTEALKPQLDAIKESIRELRQTQQDDGRKYKADILTEIAGLANRVQEMERRATASDANGTATKDAATAARTDTANALTVLAGIRVSLDELAAKVRGADPAEYLKLMREIGEKERQIAAAEAERDRAAAEAKAGADKMLALQTEIDSLKAEIAKLGGADVSNHPQFIDLRRKNQELEKSLRENQKEYDQLKGLVDDWRAKGLVPNSDGTTEVKAPESAEPYAAGFEAIVGTATYNPENQKHVIIAKVKEGGQPQMGEVLDIVNAEGKKICSFKVMGIYENNDFGGMRTDSNIAPAPTRGDRVLRPRAPQAQGN